MDDIAVPLHSWFWLIVPMLTVFALSIVNYLRSKISSQTDGINTSAPPERAPVNEADVPDSRKKER